MTGWHYLLLVNIYLLLFYGFYVLLLRKETFFNLNRVYLVAASLLSFFIPVIQSDWVKNLFITREVQLTIYSSPLIVYQFKPIQHTQVTIGQAMVVIYFAGILFLVGRFIWQMIVLNKLINQPDATIAYSFFKKIKLGADADNQVIAAHEHVHANQWHSADVLLIEAVMIINWFNPVVYLYRYAIKHIHEYIADRQALKSGTNKSDYALLLLSQTFNSPAHQLVNPFYNHSLLKQRIMMLQKNKSNRTALIKYGLSAPLFILMLILSSATVSNSKTIGFVNKKAEQIFLTPAATIPAEITTDNSSKNNTPPETKNSDQSLLKAGTASMTIDTVPVRSGPVFTVVEKVPQFPGGLEAFGNYLKQNLRYPANMRKQGIQGRVIIGYIVEEDGSLSNVRVMRGVADELDREALRVIAASPKWVPGTQNGKAVRVAYSVPISFTLTDSKPFSPKAEKTDAAENNNNSQSISLSAITTIVTKSDTNKKTSSVIALNTANPPLYILDGKEVDNLTAVNINDIETISVVHDAASTALYGFKAVHGVVIVTTKKDHQKTSPPKEPEIKH